MTRVAKAVAVRLKTSSANHLPLQLARQAKAWRREWDSNPRYGFPHTRFPSVRLKPLGHLSGCPVLKGQEVFFHRLWESYRPGASSAAKVLLPLQDRASGEMSEWLKAHAWKACVRETVPWVRIPLSPPRRPCPA